MDSLNDVKEAMAGQHSPKKRSAKTSSASVEIVTETPESTEITAEPAENTVVVEPDREDVLPDCSTCRNFGSYPAWRPCADCRNNPKNQRSYYQR